MVQEIKQDPNVNLTLSRLSVELRKLNPFRSVVSPLPSFGKMTNVPISKFYGDGIKYSARRAENFNTN